MMRAGFAEIDITPPIGTHKIGWLVDIVSDRVADPLFARAAIFDDGAQAVGFIQTDTLCVRWSTVKEIRARIERAYGFPGGAVMVAATHNHAGPAVATAGEVRRDDAYVERFIEACVKAFGEALEGLREAQVGFGHTFEWNVAHNRRVVMRDGTTRTHGSFKDPDALYIEGPIDPEVAVLAARAGDGTPLGCIINFACHPAHHGPDTVLSAGFPGVVAAKMKAKGWPVTLYLNGASGNLHTSDPTRGGIDLSMEETGAALARDAEQVIADMTFTRDATLAARSRTVMLPFRTITEDEVRGTARGAQRFVKPELYDELMPGLVARIRAQGEQPAEVQVLSVGEVDFVGIPAEYFVEHGLRIKEGAHPRHALVVGQANGMVGYVPTQQAFRRGGYETTFAPSSRLAPEAGDILADAAIALIKERGRG